VWMHTHPGNSPEPSRTDEVTFARVFGRADWAVMFIIARGGQTYARLRYNVGPGADINVPVEVAYGRPFAGSEIVAWHDEYRANVRVPATSPLAAKGGFSRAGFDQNDDVDAEWRGAWDEYVDFEHYQPEAKYGFVRDF